MERPAAPSRRRSLAAALEGSGLALPGSIAAIVWVASKIGGEYTSPLLWASLLGLAVVNWVGSYSPRPLVFTVRFFSASLLVGIIDAFALRLPAWGLDDTAQARATLAASVCVVAALCQPLLYALRAQRLARYIPAPVFAGFANATAILIAVGQLPVLESLVVQQGMRPSVMLMLALVCIAVAALVRAGLQGVPASLAGLLVASLVGAALSWQGMQVPTVLAHGVLQGPQLPGLDWTVWWQGSAATFSIVRDVLLGGALLGGAVFMNTVLADAQVAQAHEREAAPPRAHYWQYAAQAATAFVGALPVGAGTSATLGAMRAGTLGPVAMRLLALGIAVFALAGWAEWIPQAAVAALLLFEAWNLFDRASLAPISRWLSSRGRAHVSALEREDIVTWLVVVAAAVGVSMVAAIPVGVIAGLVLFARRNGRMPVRDIQTGLVCRSNCARSRRATALLDTYGGLVRRVRLQGALFFGSADLMYEQLRAALPGARFVVIDWEGVVSVDSTIGRAVARFENRAREQGVMVVHAAFASRRLLMGMEGEGTLLLTAEDGLDGERYFADTDRALEYLENQLLEMPVGAVFAPGPLEEPSALLKGFDDAQRARVEKCFVQRSMGVGEVLFAAGETSRELFILRRGTVNVMVAGGRLRVASFRAGATLGEMGFLDGTPRSATAVVADEALVSVLRRAAVDALLLEEPLLAYRLMENLGVEVSARLRSTNLQLASSRG